ncbi:fumarylacetoacetate hydrolase family protein [Umezawaea sp. Da 62-37]|uniref:fumarylacetoacetate hydrolase family protein n=1 Tax=Umezawaea sp. Da 62-37 TaxID=3075927 RepID=UPI0028F71698|nr:fumarylacetoacetate hydrolase family protein [Umezawaea sp. Da 62-37]WNV86854.1 fumarylacetoacetate hydrolase family protein [Umezawaea sp. Da 62-37]WNV87562.1 fumarylacetoacetate hydrolase family protein [Umezawaea sp. Da 62-37]
MTLNQLADRVVLADPAAVLVGRVFDPEADGPCLVVRRGDELVDITPYGPTSADLLARSDVLDVARRAEGRTWNLREVVHSTMSGGRGSAYLLAPCDLQVIKAAGVTFASSMIERVIEEQVAGDAARADGIRASLHDIVGTALAVTPGSPEAAEVKRALVEQGLWSQYLEVGIGPDPEIFTKAPVLSAVGVGADVGVLSGSSWNNPEPELVLVADPDGNAVGATLGNDVNLRDYEGRSALLLGKAKDNNASCAIGPFIRLFDEGFGLADVAKTTITTRVTGEDGFEADHVGRLADISRPLPELLAATCGRHHQYPDGFVLFTGTSFAPAMDRGEQGMGFTHHDGDIVAIESPHLGLLANTVVKSEDAAPWTSGVRSLMRNLAARGLLGAPGGAR